MEDRYSAISDALRSVPSNPLILALRTLSGVRSGVLPDTSTYPGTAVAPSSEASWMKRCIERSTFSPQSAPRRNLLEASLTRLSRLTVREIVGGSHHAISKSTSVVCSEISVVAPPMTPAKLTISSDSLVITPSSAMSSRSRPSSVVNVSPGTARRTRRWPLGIVARSKVWLG